MNQKAKPFLIAGLAILLFALVTIIILSTSLKDKLAQKQQPSAQESDGTLPELVCNYADDQAAYADAVTNQDVNQCACIANETMENTCKSIVMDAGFYHEAVKQLDEKLCQHIHNDTHQKSCLSVVEEMTKELSQSDPQHLAGVYSRNGSDQAIKYYEQLVQEDQENIDNYVNLALAYANKGLKEQESGNDQNTYVQKALDIINQAIEIDGEKSELYRVRGYVYEIKPDIVQAIQEYTRAIELDKNNIVAYSGRGHAARLGGFLDQAREDFEHAAALDVNKVQSSVYINLCALNSSMNYTEDAIKNCKIVLASDSVNSMTKSEASQVLSQMFLNNGDYVQAKNYLLNAKMFTPNDANLYAAFANLSIKEQKYADAKQYANEALQISPAKTSAFKILATALYLEGSYNEAISAANQGLLAIDKDVSLLEASKFAVKRDLYYILADAYKVSDNEKSQEFENLANNLVQ